jgi:hypothetical protein
MGTIEPMRRFTRLADGGAIAFLFITPIREVIAEPFWFNFSRIALWKAWRGLQVLGPSPVGQVLWMQAK